MIKLNLQKNKNLRVRKFTMGSVNDDFDKGSELSFDEFEKRRQKIQASLFSSNVFDILPKRKSTIDLNQSAHFVSHKKSHDNSLYLKKANSTILEESEKQE